MTNKLLLAVSASAIIAFAACSSSGGDEPAPKPNPTPSTEKLEIKISPKLNATKATDSGFESGDKIGLYVVNYTDSKPGSLLSSGNHVDNMRYTYSGSWTPDSKSYWKDQTTHADFYLYYPYRQIADIAAIPIETPADQSSEAAYKNADFMTGKAANVAPTEDAVSIAANHILSRINIKVAAGNGFSEESLKKADIDVKINNLKTHASFNLSTSQLTVTGDASSVSPFRSSDSFKAIIIPQTVGNGNLITVTIDGREYNLTKEFSFQQNKEHNFTVTVSKVSNGINVNINPWENDGSDNGGVAE